MTGRVFSLSGIGIPDKVLSSCIIRPSVSYFDFSGQTAGPIRPKFGSNVPLLTCNEDCKARSGYIAKLIAKTADLVNSFKNLLQTHQSDCFQIWVTTLGQGRNVKLRRSCPWCDRKCVKMADLVNFWKNCVNSFKNLLLKTQQSECYQIGVTALGQGPDVKLQRPYRSHDQKCVKMAVTQILQNSPETPVRMLPNLACNIRPG